MKTDESENGFTWKTSEKNKRQVNKKRFHFDENADAFDTAATWREGQQRNGVSFLKSPTARSSFFLLFAVFFQPCVCVLAEFRVSGEGRGGFHDVRSAAFQPQYREDRWTKNRSAPLSSHFICPLFGSVISRIFSLTLGEFSFDLGNYCPHSRLSWLIHCHFSIHSILTQQYELTSTGPI